MIIVRKEYQDEEVITIADLRTGETFRLPSNVHVNSHVFILLLPETSMDNVANVMKHVIREEIKTRPLVASLVNGYTRAWNWKDEVVRVKGNFHVEDWNHKIEE